MERLGDVGELEVLEVMGIDVLLDARAHGVGRILFTRRLCLGQCSDRDDDGLRQGGANLAALIVLAVERCQEFHLAQQIAQEGMPPFFAEMQHERCVMFGEVAGGQTAEMQRTDAHREAHEGAARLEIVQRIAVDQDEIFGAQLLAALFETHATVPLLDEEDLCDVMM